MRYSMIAATLAFALFSGASSANEAKAASGAKLVEDKGCVSCHGKDGNGAVLAATGAIDPQYPVLAGQYESYLEYALKSYRSGTRKNAVMLGFAEKLTDAEIKALAQYFSSVPSKIHTLKNVQ
jgi:cytochrome c553